MAFQIKDFASITASMINHARSVTTKITDFLRGSVARTLLEAPAVEIEELYLQMFIGLKEAIPVSVFQSFGFDILPPAFARGSVTITSEQSLVNAITIPAGTAFSAPDGRSYRSTEALVWAAGATSVRVKIIADAAGYSYNAAAGIVNSSPLFGDEYVISNALIANGRDSETEEERKARFAEFVGSLSKGTTFACMAAVRNTRILDDDGNITEYFTRTGISENAGFIRIYAYSSAGAPSTELLRLAQRNIDGYRDEATGQNFEGVRSGGVRCDVLTMVERSVNWAASVTLAAGYTLTESLQASLKDAFDTVVKNAPAGEILYVDEVVEALLSVTGVIRVVPDVNENIACQPNEALKAGTFTVNILGV